VAAILLAAPQTRSSGKELCEIVQRYRSAVEREPKRMGRRPPKELLVLFRLYSTKLGISVDALFDGLGPDRSAGSGVV